MLFNSPEYIAFIIIMFVLFSTTNREKTIGLRNIILLLASYFFYAQIHLWFILLLAYITIVNFFTGLWIEKRLCNGKNAKPIVALSILMSLICLAFFKYAYIFKPTILLPVGLSFFTFQALTYTIDIYRGKIKAEHNFLDLALFIAFFPTLLSGPIERARNILPQIKTKRKINWDNVTDGIKLFIWGLFKKVVIADRLAEFVNPVYSNPDSLSGSTLAMAAIFYSFQIYCDFSGYADMAIGSGRILGFRIISNFNFPYCVNTIKEFWRRWHISLTSWFTEYVYISMGGNRVTKARWLLNISTVFILSGVWHGATWSFIIWGAMHAFLYFAEYYLGPKKPNILYHILIFILITFAWIFFRIPDITMAWNVICKICTDLISPIYLGSSTFTTLVTTALLIGFIIREYLMYRGIMPQKKSCEYILLVLLICLFGVSGDQFVYFQF